MKFLEIAESFASSVGALRVFSERIGHAADEYDRSTIHNITDALSAVIPEEILRWMKEQRAEEPRGLDALGGEPEPMVAKVDAIELPDAMKQIAQEALREPDRIRRLMNAVQMMKRASVGQGEILRRGAVVSLMSQFEAVIADLLHAFYDRFPAALPADDHRMTLVTLRELGSIEDATRHIIRQEVDAVLRMSLAEQFEYFSKRPKLDPNLPVKTIEQLVEVDQRRNLYVHNRGKVNRIYLNKVSATLAATYGATDGEALQSSEEYLARAIDDVFVAGVTLVQRAWRKWDKETAEQADLFLVHATFDALCDGRYALAARLAHSAESVQFANDGNKRLVLINHAIALRELGDETGMTKIIEGTDWSACAPRFVLALAALRADEAEFFRLLPKAIAADDLEYHHVAEWPLFKNLRANDGFLTRVEGVFGDSSAVPQVLPNSSAPEATS